MLCFCIELNQTQNKKTTLPSLHSSLPSYWHEKVQTQPGSTTSWVVEATGTGHFLGVNTTFYVEMHSLLPLKKQNKTKKPKYLPWGSWAQSIQTEGLNLLMMSNLKAHNLSYPLSNSLHLLSLQEKIIIQTKAVISTQEHVSTVLISIRPVLGWPQPRKPQGLCTDSTHI